MNLTPHINEKDMDQLRTGRKCLDKEKQKLIEKLEEELKRLKGE